MEPWTRMEFQALVLAVAARSVARAGDDGSDHPFQESPDEGKTKPWLPPSAWVLIAVFVWMIIAVAVSIVNRTCRQIEREYILRRMMGQEKLMPPPLAVVISRAQKCSNPGQPPVISGAMASPVVPYPAQQCRHTKRSVPNTQVTLYNTWNDKSLPPPSAPPPTEPTHARTVTFQLRPSL